MKYFLYNEIVKYLLLKIICMKYSNEIVKQSNLYENLMLKIINGLNFLH